MPTRLSAGPLQVTSLDLTSVNYMLQQVRRELDEIKGLRGDVIIHSNVSITGTLVLTGTPSTVFAFDSAGASTYLEETGTGKAVLQTSPTILTPTIASFVNATHTHQNTAGGGTLDHGLALTGLADDDHSAYLLASSATSRAFFAASWTDLTDGGTTSLHSHAAAGGMAIGDTVTSGTTGSVLFVGAGPVLAQDNAGLFYAPSTDNLGLGTASPTFASGSGLEIERSGIATIRLESTTGPAQGELLVGNTEGFALQTLTSHPIKMIAGGSNTCFVASVNGEIGMGTAAAVATDVTLNVLGRGQSGNAKHTARFVDANATIGMAILLSYTAAAADKKNHLIVVDSEGMHFARQSDAYGGPVYRVGVSNKDNLWLSPNYTQDPSSGSAGIVFADGTAFSGMASNTAGLYADDVGGTVQMFAINEAGTAQTLTGSDPYTQYALLAGRAAGQTIKGSDASAGGGLTLMPTAGTADSGTLLKLKYGNNGASDGITLMGVNGFVGIHCTPAYVFQVNVASGPCVFELRNTAGAEESALQLIVTGGLSNIQATWEGSGSNEDIAFTPTTAAGAQTETMRISYTNNVLLKGAAAPSTGNGGLIFPDGTALATMASNTAGLYANDVGGTVNMFAINEAGTVTQLTGGFNGTVTPVTSITVVNGFVTAVL